MQGGLCWEVQGQRQLIRLMNKHIEFRGLHQEYRSCSYFILWQREPENIKRCGELGIDKNGADGLRCPLERLHFYSSVPRTSWPQSWSNSRPRPWIPKNHLLSLWNQIYITSYFSHARTLSDFSKCEVLFSIFRPLCIFLPLPQIPFPFPHSQL